MPTYRILFAIGLCVLSGCGEHRPAAAPKRIQAHAQADARLIDVRTNREQFSLPLLFSQSEESTDNPSVPDEAIDVDSPDILYRIELDWRTNAALGRVPQTPLEASTANHATVIPASVWIYQVARDSDNQYHLLNDGKSIKRFSAHHDDHAGTEGFNCIAKLAQARYDQFVQRRSDLAQ